MSLLVSLTNEATAQLQLAHPHTAAAPIAAAGDGLLDWAAAKNTATQGLFRGVSVTLGIAFVIWQAVKSHMAMARVIISIIAAGVLVWGVWNVTQMKDRVDTEVNSLPALVQTAAAPTGVVPL